MLTARPSGAGRHTMLTLLEDILLAPADFRAKKLMSSAEDPFPSRVTGYIGVTARGPENRQILNGSTASSLGRGSKGRQGVPDFPYQRLHASPRQCGAKPVIQASCLATKDARSWLLR
jgi:hypothetical protein